MEPKFDHIYGFLESMEPKFDHIWIFRVNGT
jgi:hypothetical protein